jgi:predicted Zn-dependent protease
MKIALQGLAIAASVFLLWLGLSQFDYVSFFKVKQNGHDLETALGELIWKEIARTEDVVTNDSLVKTLDKLIIPLCEANGIERDSLKVHIIEKDEINAFALPNNHLVVYTGLIVDSKKQEALQGVLGHEMAHIEYNHVMKKLSKEIGFSVLLSATTGGKAGEVVKEIFTTLSSSAYDRSLEKEADMASVDYLIAADIDPKPFADFMYEMALDSQMPKEMYWIASHPESEERAQYILEYLKGKKLKKKQTLTEKEWQAFQEQAKAL